MNLSGFGVSYFILHVPFTTDISPALWNGWHVDGTCSSHFSSGSQDNLSFGDLPNLLSKWKSLQSFYCLCPVLIQMLKDRPLKTWNSQSSVFSKFSERCVFKIHKALFSSEPELLLTYFKIFHDVAPACLNSLVSVCGTTPFYLFITSRFAEDFFWLSATQPEGQAGIHCMLVFWNFTIPGFACYFRLLKTLFL